MGLQGYERQSGRRNGGITEIALAEVAAVGSVRYDRATGNAESIGMTEGGTFALYHFREDSAWFTERTVTEAGFMKVERELGFTLERLDGNERESVRELLARSRDGLVAIVRNGCGALHLLGLSRRFGNSCPLKVKATELATGKSPADLSGEVVILANEDTAKAPLFTGEVPLGDSLAGLSTGTIPGDDDTLPHLPSGIMDTASGEEVAVQVPLPKATAEEANEGMAMTDPAGTGQEAADGNTPVAVLDPMGALNPGTAGPDDAPQQDENL